MSFNDRLDEAARWVASQPGDTVALPKDLVAEVLREAAIDPSRCPWQLHKWVRDPQHRASQSGWSQECWDAAVPADAWPDGIHPGDDPFSVQPKHADCLGASWRGGVCECPCHGSSAAPAG